MVSAVAERVKRRSLGNSISIERTLDYALASQFITHPRVYRALVDDSCGPPDTYKVCESEAVIYALVRCDGEPAGVFIFVPENGYTVQVHTCLSPKMWGAAFVAAREVIRWLFETTGYLRINTQVPMFNTLAARLAIMAGMEPYGLCPAAFMKGGQLWPIALYGISKGG